MRRRVYRPDIRTFGSAPTENRQAGGRVDPADGDQILQRFTDMLMNDFRVGAAGRSGPDALYPSQPQGPQRQGQEAPAPPNLFLNSPPRFQRTTIIGSGPGGGQTSFTISTGTFQTNRSGNPAEVPDFNTYEPPPARPLSHVAPPTSPMTPKRRYVAGVGVDVVDVDDEVTEAPTNSPTRVFGNLMNNIPPPTPADANDPNRASGPAGAGPGPQQRQHVLAASLHEILAALLNPMPGGVHGDAVYSQEALDRIITNLMESNPQSNAAPPASGAAIESLERKAVDDEMLGPEGKAECTICIDSMNKGDEAVVLPCKHWFHGECVTMWLKEHNTCPICRTPIEGPDTNNNNPQQQPPTAAQSRAASAGPSGFMAFSRDPTPSSRSRGERSFRSPRENEERLNAIRSLGGYTGGSRRSSMSPPAQTAAENPSRSRARSPSYSRDRDRNRGYGSESDRQSRDSNNSRGGDGSGGHGYGAFSWLRDQFSRNSGSGSGSSRRQ